MTVPKKKRKKRKKKQVGWYIGGPHSTHPGLDFAAGGMGEAQLRRYIRGVLLETQADGFPRELHVYDFDGTLMGTPEPDTGKATWEEVTGEPWPHRGWWGQPESLDTEVFDIQPNTGVVSAFQQSMADPDVHTIVLTGRHMGLVREVQTILDMHGLSPDELKLTPAGLSTLNYKQKVLRKWARTVPLERIVMWEDRDAHATAFESMSDELGVPVEVHKV